jgi:hypothetical protein
MARRTTQLPLTLDQQRAQLDLVVETAADLWG